MRSTRLCATLGNAMNYGIDHHTVIDAAMDAYLDWRQQSAGVEAAYQRWSAADSTDAALAFAAYVAALDREERASASYEDTIWRSGHLLGEDVTRAAPLREAA
jgi:hypothetical protein